MGSAPPFRPGALALALATFPVDARDAAELFEQADRALYEAKRRGRDRVSARSTSARASGA